MPWHIVDVDRHKKGLSKKSKKKWVAIANSVLKSKGDEVAAIKIANSQTKRINEKVEYIVSYIEKKIYKEQN
jgi:uncharacterized protein YdaT